MKFLSLVLLLGTVLLLVACTKKQAEPPGLEFPVIYNAKPTPAVVISPVAPLGVQPVLGRNFHPDDFRPDATPIAVISHDFWMEASGQSPQIIGSKIRFGDLEFIVVGVMPAKPDELAGRKVWISKRG